MDSSPLIPIRYFIARRLNRKAQHLQERPSSNRELGALAAHITLANCLLSPPIPLPCLLCILSSRLQSFYRMSRSQAMPYSGIGSLFRRDVLVSSSSMSKSASSPTAPTVSRLNATTSPVDKKCILFPSYALRSSAEPDSDWLLRVKGRTFSKGKPSRANKLALGVFRRVAGVEKESQEFTSLEERLGLFFESQASNHHLTVEILGVTHSGNMVLESEEPFADEPEPLFEDGFPFCESLDAPKIPELSQSNSSSDSSNFSTPDSSIYVDKGHSTKVVVKDGHFNSPIYLPGDLIKQWTSSAHLKEDSPRSLDIRAYDGSSDAYTSGKIQLIDPVGISIISDIDDTIKDSGVFRGKRHLIMNTFLHECREVPGMSELYREWSEQGANFHYVSNSPWQLFPLLETFFDKFSFPSGSAHLKLWDLNHKALFYDPQAAKRTSIVQLLKDFPNRKFILVGDSGEMDLELYTSIAKEYPNQVLKIFIRDVTTPNLVDATSPYGSASESLKYSTSTVGLPDSTPSSTQTSRFSWREAGRWKSLKAMCSRGSNLMNLSSLSVSSLNQSPSPSNSGKDLSDGSLNSDEEVWNESATSPRLPTMSQMAVYAKLQQRVAQATASLSPTLLTLFTSPSSLRECPIVQSNLVSKAT
ncbi:hypothetical protein DSO57_1019505 [Entomophthora muscae]|uniref:Uncharacterized protein n=1 Tax=Entomophthora muscae TaxID=34485 RepID=A0ACC2TFA2_9FUNG|nr:hypothetical protein DSO57_1019505 [Entomophthora muscae]